MAHIQPLQALRYTPYAGEFNQLVAPAHDILDSGEREYYASQSLYNVVHLTVPEQHSDDRHKFIRYARSAALLSEWNFGIKDIILLKNMTSELIQSLR